MSESLVRKIQPFTIRTKLSTPAFPKCADTAEHFLLKCNISDHCKTKHQNEEICPNQNHQEEEHLNCSTNSASRSIHRITISSHMETTRNMRANTENINNNNNIKTSCTQLPKITSVSCEKKPSLHFKVLLCKNGEEQCSGEEEDLISSPETQNTLGVQSCEDKVVNMITKVTSIQNEEQHHALIKQEIAQTGDELKPECVGVKSQQSQVRDQLNLHKVTKTDQTMVVDRAKTMQVFNMKVDRLEAWIKDKEHKISLESILKETTDKMHITRRILDLKQDEQLYAQLHEEINLLALKMEKQGKAETKSVTARRKHINKMWLKAQSQLKDYNETLQMALEVSSFFHQAENIICSIKNMKGSSTGCLQNRRDGEIRDIASQLMEMDVSVSQLSKLQPSLASQISQKQSELKECWTALQRTLREEKTASSRETHDPELPNPKSLNSVGTELQRIMGKESKEEQNALKGFMCVQDVQCSRNPSDVRDSGVTETQFSKRLCDGTQPEGRSHPIIHTQLQKFTVSADKTLSWLKESVAFAAQIGSSSELNSFDSTKRRQASLEQDILSYRARIELVKTEGHSLVRAQHPESLKIQQFLTQLERLWEELKRRNQRNTLLLKLSEELNCRVVCVLQSLCALEAWLQAVHLSLTHSSLMGNRLSVKEAEQSSHRLEQELELRTLELQQLKLQADTLSRHTLLHLSRHTHLQLSPNTLLHAKRLPARLQEVEDRFASVQMALRQQRSELKDTRMLTEFLEKLEIEESHYSSPTQPLCRELDSGSSLCDEPLMIENPVQELREAVEMLNDTERERGRSQSREQSMQELVERHNAVCIRVKQCLQRCSDLALDVLRMESEMVIRCELDQSGLEQLREDQDLLEAEYTVLKTEVEAIQSQWSSVTRESPERAAPSQSENEHTRMLWHQLETSVSESRSRLLQFTHLRGFFRRYLDMISWTEETRWCIFSDAALRPDRGMQLLDEQIELKFEEFDRLVADGTKLSDHQHHLSHMVEERLEELRSMLGWIRLHWRTQKDQLVSRQKSDEAQTDNIYCEAKDYSSQTPKEPISEMTQRNLECPPAAPPAGIEDNSPLGYEYEIMKSVNPKEQDVSDELDGSESPYLTVKEPRSSSPRERTVSLILSFKKNAGTQIQVQEPSEGDGESRPEPVHRSTEADSPVCKSFWKRCQGLFGSLKRKKKINRQSAEEVSAYLHLTDNTMTAGPVYEIMSPTQDNPPRSSSSSPMTLPSAFLSPSPCFSPSPEDTNPPSVPLLPKNGNVSIFNSLKRTTKKVKIKKDDCRHSIQKIMCEEHSEGTALSTVDESVNYDTQTWPLKEWKKCKTTRKAISDGSQVLEYMKNPLVKEIDAECPIHNSETPTQAHMKNHCRFLSLGSALSFDLPKNMSLIPSVQDVITIIPPEQKKADSCPQDSQIDRPASLSTFKIARSHSALKEELKLAALSRITPEDNKMVNNGSMSPTEDNFPPPPSPILENISFEENHHSSVKNIDIPKHPCGIETGSFALVNQMNKDLENLCVSPLEDAIQRNSSVMSETEGGSATSSRTELSSPNCLSNVVLTFRANAREDSVDSGHSSSGSFKLCLEDPNLDALESAKVPKNPTVLSTVNVEIDRFQELSKEETLNVSLDIDPIHPDHQQFEQEEEELEDIWNQNNIYRQSLNSDIMYETYQAMLANSSIDHSIEQSTLFKKMITASAPNLLVTEFKLPSSAQRTLGLGTREEGQSLDKWESRSWAAFGLQDQIYKDQFTNETVSDLVKLPEIVDQEKYIYHYGEEEEEEEEGFVKDESMRLLSVHSGLEDSNDSNIQNERYDLELPYMEGMLERKHKLQLGGKKAPCRTWSSYHAVLYKHTIRFHQNRKETQKSCDSILPLNLIGAVCEPSPEYTKKPNCFNLRLRDGSEYLLSASSWFMMKKWILRIQAHTASPGPSSSVKLSGRSPALISSDPDPSLCSIRSDVISRVSPWSKTDLNQSREIIEHSSELQQNFLSLLDPALQRDECDPMKLKPVNSMSTVQDWTTEKKRSLSFTAATYQRVRPVAPLTGRPETSSSSYSVTLLISEHKKPLLCKTPSDSQNLSSRNFFSLPRATGKAGFRGIFRKKE